MFDLGFLGVEVDYLEQRSSLPVKKEKDCELTVQEKEYNKNHSRNRIVVVLLDKVDKTMYQHH